MNYYSCGFFFNPESQKVLLHLRDEKAPVNPNKWALFGGMSETEDKDPVATFIREIEEELGVNVVAGEVVYLIDYLTPVGHQRFVYFVSKNITDSEIKLSEGKDYGWFSLLDAFDLDLTKGALADLKTFKKFVDRI